MAPTTVYPMVHAHSLEPLEMGGTGRRRLSLDSWVCLPMLWPGRTIASSTTTCSSGSSCTTRKEASRAAKAPTLDVNEEEPAAAAAAVTHSEPGCKTPKSKEHRIPDVDVGFCPPAPRKPRAMTRRRRVQPTSFLNSPDFENFISQNKVPVSS